MPENQQRTPSGHSGSRQRGVLPSLYLGMMAAALATGAWAQEHPQHNDAVAQPGQGPMRGQMRGQMQGMMGEGRQDMDTIHALFSAHQQIARTVKKLDTGVETLTESADPKVQALIREHVQTMYQRLSAGQPIRQWDPLYAEIFRQAGKIHMELSNTAKGIKVIETSTDPWVVKLLHAHADGVSEFVDQGMAAMHKEHPLPAAVSEPRANSEKVVPEMKVTPPPHIRRRRQRQRSGTALRRPGPQTRTDHATQQRHPGSPQGRRADHDSVRGRQRNPKGG